MNVICRSSLRSTQRDSGARLVSEVTCPAAPRKPLNCSGLPNSLPLPRASPPVEGKSLVSSFVRQWLSNQGSDPYAGKATCQSSSTTSSISSFPTSPLWT